MGEIFFAFSKARCFGLPKHNLALPNHTACRRFMPPALQVTSLALSFFFHPDFVCCPAPTGICCRAASSCFQSPAFPAGLPLSHADSRSGHCDRCTGVMRHVHAICIPALWLQPLSCLPRHCQAYSVYARNQPADIRLYLRWRWSSG